MNLNGPGPNKTQGWWRRKRQAHRKLLVPRAPAPASRTQPMGADMEGGVPPRPHISAADANAALSLRGLSDTGRLSRVLLPQVIHFLWSRPQLTPRSPLRVSRGHNSSQRCNRLWANDPCSQELGLVLCKLAVPTRQICSKLSHLLKVVNPESATALPAEFLAVCPLQFWKEDGQEPHYRQGMVSTNCFNSIQGAPTLSS